MDVWSLKVSGALLELYKQLVKQIYEEEGIIITPSGLLRNALKKHLLDLLDKKKDYSELLKYVKFDEERRKERMHLEISKDIIKKHTYVNYVYRYYKKNLLNNPISTRRKNIIMSVFYETAKRRGISKKEIDKAIKAAGHQNSFEIKTVKKR